MVRLEPCALSQAQDKRRCLDGYLTLNRFYRCSFCPRPLISSLISKEKLLYVSQSPAPGMKKHKHHNQQRSHDT